MASSGEEYFVARNKKIERKKRLLTIVSVVSFIGSGLFSIATTLKQASQNQHSQSVVVSEKSLLQQQAQGYELVLQREPKNQVALEKLSLVKLQLKDMNGAIAPLEKLVKLHPDRQDYKIVLNQIKKQNDGK
ncbi:tetratricopeptide repeat protein [Nostoc sp. TCL26-01]|uniref:tetratricopeptide repeat protein n=1 Tax=Nostoc sp. TCL26-01 TaxID=2576904 RepID=UPI0015B99EE9|nr:tetratricopeptide repeat protein [Nostoc sp. TCL26-01]QLE59129.1 tetratricopeptide repeat protein [Nostoc sp. TCL26-01]